MRGFRGLGDWNHGRDSLREFETAEEFVLALEREEGGLLAAPRATPYSARDPAKFWYAVALVSVVFNLLLLYLIAVR